MNFTNKTIIENILLIRLSSLGDVLLTTPLIRALKKKLPSARVDFAVQDKYLSIIKSNPYIENCIPYDKSKSSGHVKKEFMKFLKRSGIQRYDLILDLQNNLRSRMLCLRAAGKILRYDKNRMRKLSLVYLKKKQIDADFHVVNNYIKAAGVLGLTPDEYGAEFWLPEEMGLSMYPPVNMEKRKTGDIIGISPGARHFTKIWPKEKYSQLAKLLLDRTASEIRLFGSKDEIEICNYIRQQGGESIKNYAGCLSLVETVRKIDECSLFITNDSGLMHVAAARNIPVVAIFGSTVRELGFTPYNAVHKIVEVDLDCRPCSHIGRDSCPKGHFNCMNMISPEQVEGTVNRMLKVL